MILKNLLGKSEDGTKEHISSEAYNIKWGQSGDCPICGEVNLWLAVVAIPVVEFSKEGYKVRKIFG